MNITFNGQPVEQIERFVYSDQPITENEIARTAFIKMRNVMTNPKLSTSARLRFIKCYVWLTLLYGVETRTISKSSQPRLEAFEM